jgi:cell division protein FtsB
VKQDKPGWVSRARAVAYRGRRWIAIGAAVLFTISFTLHVAFGRNGVDNYEHKRAQDKVLQQQIDSLEKENSALKDHVDRLKNDPDAIEYEAREKLHYARPGEVIYRLNQQPKPDTDQPPARPANGGSN